VLKVADEPLAAELRSVLASGEDYASLAKPQIDWDDQAARQGWWMPAPGTRRRRWRCCRAARLLAAVVGQDLEQPSEAASGSRARSPPTG